MQEFFQKLMLIRKEFVTSFYPTVQKILLSSEGFKIILHQNILGKFRKIF